ncbi:hypothetical protein [Sphingobium sp. YR768]|uniref:hypothetical protein n=1 Tax=Sphingobium sp. YR768 TaxID=1884365 RepID=UPI0008C73352|nr:hypothetical protein [Sphingobium sp. YR768]SER40965.1 hypothetical protein SAMN05518866_110134 [Sphingobium sp. YR768]
MWKALLGRRPLRRRTVPIPDRPPIGKDRPVRDDPFADLIAQLNKIPYQRRRKAGMGC